MDTTKDATSGYANYRYETSGSAGCVLRGHGVRAQGSAPPKKAHHTRGLCRPLAGEPLLPPLGAFGCPIEERLGFCPAGSSGGITSFSELGFASLVHRWISDLMRVGCRSSLARPALERRLHVLLRVPPFRRLLLGRELGDHLVPQVAGQPRTARIGWHLEMAALLPPGIVGGRAAGLGLSAVRRLRPR